ncbi:hypothetical protein [Epilithonimonas xixisoli]|uniref:Uncharacterized protein n=1 Tax=Epilithonimonas xixisoli TaxID=1476462 RepID=A0A4R8I3A8_9FLAO|nr:hypothetical protein [Epilithonimonas xixisoli]TDX82764.1 hypothetical protein B0I22_2791 [Epilithonimonas xixisoli]
MEIPKYLYYTDFKENYLIDFENVQSSRGTLLWYSNQQLKIYKEFKEFISSPNEEVFNDLFRILCKDTALENYELDGSEFDKSALMILHLNTFSKILELDKIIEFLENETDREKINLFKFQNNTNQTQNIEIEHNITKNYEALHVKTQTIYDFFDKVKDEDFGRTDILMKLKELSHNFDIDILRSILYDLDYYLFVERDEKESEFTPEDIDNAIEERNNKGLEIPYHKITPNGIVGDAKILNKEELLFPFEFYNLYSLKNLINKKINTPEKIINKIVDTGEITQNKNSALKQNQIDIDLLKYLSDNFTSSGIRFNELTKYNQIYRFLNEGRDYNIEHRAYKNLIKDLFNFDYLNREISMGTQKHLTQLENLALNYNNSKK